MESANRSTPEKSRVFLSSDPKTANYNGINCNKEILFSIFAKFAIGESGIS